MTELHAFVAPQGNVFSRKAHDPSGYQVSTPKAFPKTFRTLNAAVLFAVKQGCKVSLVKPLKPSGQAAWLETQFNQSLEQAALTIEASRAQRDEE